MSAWEEYKKRVGETRPWDLLNPNIEKLTAEEAAERLKTCKECDRYLKVTSQCRECGCVMIGKVKLKSAVCPIGKW